MLFYFDRDYYTLAELVRLPDRKKYGACVYIDADGSRQDRPGYANDIALRVDEWRRENGIPFDKSTIAASPSEVDGGEFDTMDEALRYLYTCKRRRGAPRLTHGPEGEAGRTATGGYGIRPYGVGVDACIDPGS